MKPAILALATVVAAIGLALTLASTTPAHAELDFVVGDPVGDTLGVGAVQHDITTVSGLTDATNFYLTIGFVGPIEPPDSGTPNALLGFVVFDTDQDPSTGMNIDEEIAQFCPEPLGVGAEATLSLFFYADGAAQLTDADGGLLADVPLTFHDDASFTATIPLAALGGDELFNFAAVMGTGVPFGKGKAEAEVTDCAPEDGGFIDTAGLLATPVPTATATATSTLEPAAATPTATAAAIALPNTGDGAGPSSQRWWFWPAAALAALVFVAGGYAVARRR
jgi:hypothetical protein